MKLFNIFLKRYWPFLAYFLISVVFLSPILFQKGLPFSQDWAWPLFNPGKGFWLQFSDFSSGYIGVFAKYILLIFSGLGYVLKSSSLIFKLVIFLVHFSAASFFYLFISKFTKSKPVAFIAGLAYAFTPYIFIRTVVGFLFSMIAYAALPLFFSIFSNSQKSVWQYLALGFIFSMIFSQTQAGLLLTLFLIVYSIVSLSWRRFSVIKETALTYLALTLVNLPWIIYTATRPKISLASGNSVTTLGRIAALPHSYRLMLMSADFEFTNNFFIVLSHNKLYFLGWLIVWLVCLCAIFNKKYRPLIISLIISAASIIPFFKGPAGIFANFYLFVYNHFPQIMVFRDTDHFEFLIAFVLIVLFAFGLDWLWEKAHPLCHCEEERRSLRSDPVGNLFNRDCRASRRTSAWLAMTSEQLHLILVGFKILLAASIIVIIYPYLTFNYAGYTPMRQIPSSYNELYNYFQNNQDICHKIYYPPGLDFVYFKGDTSPGASNGDAIAGSLGVPYLHGGTSILNTPSVEMFYQNELVSQFYEKTDNGEFTDLLNQGGVDCVVVRQDIDTKYAEAMNLKFEKDPAILAKWNQSDWLVMAQSKKGLVETKSFGNNIHIFKISNDKFLISNQITNSNIQSIQTIEQLNNRAINYLPLTDWADYNSYYKNGWTRGRYDFWRKLLFTKLRQDFIYTDKPDSILSGKIDQSGSYEVWTRLLIGGTGGNFQLQISPQGQQKLDNSKFLISKNTGAEKFVWKKIGETELTGRTNIDIKNISGENAIADIVLVKSK